MICIENFDNLTNHLPDLNWINTTILNLKQWDTGERFRAIMALLFCKVKLFHQKLQKKKKKKERSAG